MIIPDHVLEKMDAGDRAKLPKKIRETRTELEVKLERSLELQMHNQFATWLTLRKKVFSFIHANPARRSTIRKGWPDFTVLYCPGPMRPTQALMIEFKTLTGRLSPAQIECFDELSAAGQRLYICDSVGEAITQTIEYFELKPEALQ